MSRASQESSQDTSQPPTSDDKGRTRLNVTLYAATVLLGCLAVALGYLIWDARGEQVDGVDVVPGAGQDVGRGVVQAVPAADEGEQKRTAAQIEAASQMVTSFVNFDHKDPDRTIKAVQERSTGEFLKQYNEGVSGLKELAAEAQSTMQASVVWSGLVAGDDDSATVIVATTGAVTNKTTKFKKEARNYRIQVELVLEKGRWLTSDLQYVELG